MAILRAEELTYTKVRALDFGRTICFLPVSALEVHGPHLPLGMDFFMARWMAEETGRRFAEAHPGWTVVQYPPLPLGTDELPLAGSMNADQRTVYGAVRAHGESLARAGFRYVVVTNGHGGPRHAAALEAACRHLSKRRGVHMFSPSIAALHAIISGQKFEQIEEVLQRSLTDEERSGLVGGEHAGGWETSFMLVQQPELIEPEWRRLGHDSPPPFAPLQRAADAITGWMGRRGRDVTHLREISGGLAEGIGWLLNAHFGYGGASVSYHGNPSLASPEMGQAFREVMVRECLAHVEAVTSGRTPATAVRSIASDPAIIQPRFWSRLGLAAVAVILAFLIF